MSYSKPVKTIIPTPATATLELHTSIVARATTHFSKILKPELIIANRKGCYATIINATVDGKSLEETLGTVNAKIATADVLTAITAKFSAIK